MKDPPSARLDVPTLHDWLARMRTVRVLVVGDLMLDQYIWGDATRISPEAPVPVVQVDRETYTAGGAANVALNIRALGAAAVLCGRLGDDAAGARLTALLAEHGVELAPGCVKAGLVTTVKTRVVCRRQQLCRLDREAPPGTHALTPADIHTALAPLARTAHAVVLSDYAKGVLTSEAIAALQRLAPATGLVALDPKPRSTVTYAGLGLMTPNRAEALQLAGLDETVGPFPAEEACARIHARFRPARLVVTLGSEGMLLSAEGRLLERIPTAAREVFDVSGAGDTVIAALTTALAAGLTLPEAARFANTAAGVVVGKLGTATASPDELRAAVETLP